MTRYTSSHLQNEQPRNFERSNKRVGLTNSLLLAWIRTGTEIWR